MEEVSTIPVVDFSAFSVEHKTRPNTESAEVQELAKNVINAFSTVGFVYLKNHGIAESLFDRVLQAGDEFFAQTTDVKSKYQMKMRGAMPLIMNGWNGLERERVNQARAPGDLKETFHITGIYDADDSVWPEQEVPSFRPSLYALYLEYKELISRVMAVIAIGLGLDPDTFVPYHQHMGTKDCRTQMKLCRYPGICPGTCVKPDQTRCGEHTDYGTLTLVYQDQAGGLEVGTKDGNFIPATPIKGALVVNVGNLLQRWTADRLRATPHRVVIPEDEDKRAIPRRSIIFFGGPDPDAVITCLDGSDKYPAVTAWGYIMGLVEQTFTKALTVLPYQRTRTNVLFTGGRLSSLVRQTMMP